MTGAGAGWGDWDWEPSEPDRERGRGRRRDRAHSRRLLVGAIALAAVIVVAVVAFVAGSGDRGNAKPGDAANEAAAAGARRASSTSGATARAPASKATASSTGGGRSAPAPATPTTVIGPNGVMVGPNGAVAPTGPPSAPPTTVDPRLTKAYVDAFRDRCAKLWSRAGGDGLLWDADDPAPGGHPVDECLDALDPTDAWFYDTVADANQGGADAATTAAEDLTVGNRLRATNGEAFSI